MWYKSNNLNINSDGSNLESSEFSFRFAQTYPPAFLHWMNKQLVQEGGVKNWSASRGGLTNKGIIQSEYDEYRKRNGLPKRSVEKITDDELKKIYYENYWLKLNLAKMPESIAYITATVALLRSAEKAARQLQKIIRNKISSQPVTSLIKGTTIKNLSSLTNNFKNEKDIALKLFNDLSKFLTPQVAKGMGGYASRLVSMKKDLLELINASSLKRYFAKLKKLDDDLVEVINEIQQNINNPSLISNASFMTKNEDVYNPLNIPPSSISTFE